MAKKVIKITIKDEFETHDKIKGKVKEKGQRKPIYELKVGDDYHNKTGKWNYRRMEIDRKNDKYREIIRDKETGEIIHFCEEPLSQHKGHGSAKFKKTGKEKK